MQIFVDSNICDPDAEFLSPQAFSSNKGVDGHAIRVDKAKLPIGAYCSLSGEPLARSFVDELMSEGHERVAKFAQAAMDRTEFPSNDSVNKPIVTGAQELEVARVEWVKRHSRSVADLAKHVTVDFCKAELSSLTGKQHDKMKTKFRTSAKDDAPFSSKLKKMDWVGVLVEKRNTFDGQAPAAPTRTPTLHVQEGPSPERMRFEVMGAVIE